MVDRRKQEDYARKLFVDTELKALIKKKKTQAFWLMGATIQLGREQWFMGWQFPEQLLQKVMYEIQ